MLLGGTVATQAFTPNVAEEVDHFVECFGWMIVDPAMHESECSPGRVPIYDPASIAGSGDGTYIAPVPTTTMTIPSTTVATTVTLS